MKDVLIVKDLIKLLLDFNPYAEVYLNVDGSSIGLSKSNICYSGGGDSAEPQEKDFAKEVYFDITESEYDKQ